MAIYNVPYVVRLFKTKETANQDKNFVQQNVDISFGKKNIVPRLVLIVVKNFNYGFQRM